MVGFEYAPRVVEQLAVAWMVDGLDRHNLLHQRRSMLPDVLDKLCLFIRRTGDEHRPRIGNRFGNTLEKRMILRRMPAADAVGLVVEMTGRPIRVNDKLIRLGDAEMKYPRLPMIDPDNRVIVSHLTLAASWPTSDAKRAATWWMSAFVVPFRYGRPPKPGNSPWRSDGGPACVGFDTLRYHTLAKRIFPCNSGRAGFRGCDR